MEAFIDELRLHAAGLEPSNTEPLSHVKPDPGKSLTTEAWNGSTELNKCDACGKRYNHLKDLKRHIKQSLACQTRNLSHQENDADQVMKPYRCGMCGKRYRNPGGLKYHTTHSSACSAWEVSHKDYEADEIVKPHKCAVCGKRYKNPNGLKYHQTHAQSCQIQNVAQEADGSGQSTGYAQVVSNIA